MKFIFVIQLAIFILQFGIAQNKNNIYSKRFPSYQPDTSNHERKFLISELDKYIRKNFKINDSTIITNNSYGQSSQYSVNCKLNHGHIYGYGGEYEGFGSAVIFHKVPLEGVHDLVYSILEQIEIIDRAEAKKIFEPGWHRIPMEELCCSVAIEADGKDIQITITNSD